MTDNLEPSQAAREADPSPSDIKMVHVFHGIQIKRIMSGDKTMGAHKPGKGLLERMVAGHRVAHEATLLAQIADLTAQLAASKAREATARADALEAAAKVADEFERINQNGIHEARSVKRFAAATCAKRVSNRIRALIPREPNHEA